jgi:hypothetical protein
VKYSDANFLLRPQFGTDSSNTEIIIIKLWYVKRCGVVDRDQIVEGNSACNYIASEGILTK